MQCCCMLVLHTVKYEWQCWTLNIQALLQTADESQGGREAQGEGRGGRRVGAEGDKVWARGAWNASSADCATE